MPIAVELVCVGKLKNSALKELENHYLKQLNFINLEVIEVKNLNDKIFENLNKDQIFLLTEQAQEFDSIEFSKFIEKKYNQISKKLVFFISDAVGFTKEQKSKYHKISLSKLTFPHKIARLIFIEQIYRAQSLLTSHPYHN